MKFEKTNHRRNPPVQGFDFYSFDVEGGPQWEETNWRRTATYLHRVVKLTVKVYDDGTTEYTCWENRIKKDGTPFEKGATRMWPGSYSSHVEEQSIVINAFRTAAEAVGL